MEHGWAQTDCEAVFFMGSFCFDCSVIFKMLRARFRIMFKSCTAILSTVGFTFSRKMALKVPACTFIHELCGWLRIVERQVWVWFEREYGKDGSPLLAICCHVKKKDVPAFLAALEDLKDKMILCGYQEYEQDVRIMLDSLESAKGAKQNNETNSTQKAEQT